MFPLYQKYFERGKLVQEWYQPLPPEMSYDEIEQFNKVYGTEIVFSSALPYVLVLRISEDLWENTTDEGEQDETIHNYRSKR